MSITSGRLAAGVLVAMLAAGCSADSAEPSGGETPSSAAIPSATASAAESASAPVDIPSFAADPSLTPAPGADEAVAVIDGVEYSCDELMGSPETGCNEALTAYFARWADNMGDYLAADPVIAARQVLLPPLSDGQVLTYALIACGGTEVGTDQGTDSLQVLVEFEDYILASRPGSDVEAIDDLYYEAIRHLCPDVELIIPED
jgi:hypothetical protein